MFSARKNDKGFTLVELMMVIVILGVLAGVAIPMLGNMKASAWQQKLQTSMDAIGTAIVYQGGTGGALPATAADVDDYVTIPADIDVVADDATCADDKGCIEYVVSGTTLTLTPYYDKAALGTAHTYTW